MQPTNERSRINARISRTLLERRQQDDARLGELYARFHEGLARDAAMLDAVVRAIQAPGGPSHDSVTVLTEFVRNIVREEMER